MRTPSVPAAARLTLAVSAAIAMLAVTARAAAVEPPASLVQPPANVLTLSASATVELTMDWLTVTYGTTKEGSDATQVQAQLRQALETALAEARKAARPGEVEVRTGAFSLYPRYAQPRAGSAPAISGWQGTAELVVEGRDTAAIAQTMGRIGTLTVARVGWSLSRQARERVEGEVSAQAIARWRAKADAMAKQFGFAGYSVREVAVDASAPGAPQPMMRMQAAPAALSDAAMPVEAGKALVTATVNGSVQMK